MSMRVRRMVSTRDVRLQLGLSLWKSSRRLNDRKNISQIAGQVGIGRASVYRILGEAGLRDKAEPKSRATG